MFHNVQQNTDEWDELRAGKATGSAASKIMAVSSELKVLATGKDFGIANMATKKVLVKRYPNKLEADNALASMKKKDLTKAFGDLANKLAVDIAVARLTGKSPTIGYSNDHMERGHQQEPVARQLYEDKYFCNVLNGGFFENGKTGCSPDGLIGDNGVIEIKSVIPHVHHKRFKSKSYDMTYRWQLAFNLRETGRDWIDFVSYCADFPTKQKLFIQRLTKEDFKVEFEQIKERLELFEKLIEKVAGEITNG